MAQVVVESQKQLYEQSIFADGHRWNADEPSDQGGRGQGPSPYRLLLSALGACTSMTVQMYASRKGWPLESVRVELDHQRIHAKDCEDCQSADGFVADIALRLQLSGDLSEEQRQRLLEIAGKCPVKKTLTGEVRIRCQLVQRA